MARQVVGNPFDNQIPTVSPTAQIVDTYYRVTPERSPLAGIAESLQRFKAKSQQPLANMENRAIERELAEGQRLYNENRINIGEAVKQGIIEEGESPYLRKGYRIAQMNTLSMRYTAELESALERQKLYTNGNPQRIEKFISEFQNQFLEKNGLNEFSDVEVTEYFGTSANKSNELFRDAWRKKHIAWQRQQNYLAFEKEVAEATVNVFRPDMSLEERQDAMGNFSKWLEAKAENANVDGMNNTDVINTILAGVGIAVEQTGQTDILDVFKTTKFGTAAAASSLKVQAKLIDIENKAIRLEEARARREEVELQEAYETARATTRAIGEKFYSQPTEQNRLELEAAIRTLMTTPDDTNTSLGVALRKELEAYDKAFVSGGVNKTPQSELRIDADLQRAKTYEEAASVISRAADMGEIKDTDVSVKLNLWKTQYDPALNEKFGLDFNTSTTTEGREMRDLKRIIRGNDFDFTQQGALRASREARKYELRVRSGVQLFVEENGRLPLPHEFDTLAYQAKEVIISELIGNGVLDELEDNNKK